MIAKTINGKTTAEIYASFEASISDGYQPTLAIIFVSISQDREAIIEIFEKNNIAIFGATSSGEFINGHQSEGAIVIMLLDLDPTNFHIAFEDIGNRTLADAATSLTQHALQKFSNPAFILCSTMLSADGKILEGETLIQQMEKLAGSQVNIFGGMAGDDISFTGTYVFTNDQGTDYGMVALVLNEDKVELRGIAISGWKPMGIAHTITSSEDNQIYTIDNKPALETYMHFLGEDITSADDQLKFFDAVGIYYPLQIERGGREPKMCNPIGYDKEKKALMCESEVPQGSSFRFSTPPDFDIIDTVINSAREMKNKTNEEAEALLVFSCAGRLGALGPMAQQENEGLADVWNVPMAGFYTYGEFGKAINDKHDFHSTTNSWVALKEKTTTP
jgi:hypothetical protein